MKITELSEEGYYHTSEGKDEVIFKLKHLNGEQICAYYLVATYNS